MSTIRFRVAFVVLLLVPGLSAAPPLDVVRDGRPVATVVLEPDAGDQVRAAADLLVSLVEQSTGARLPVADRAPHTGTVIYIGGELDRETLALDPPLDDDGFVIAFPDDRSLRIAGPTDWGTEFGVYEFLERYVGVRWLLPGEDGTDVPELTRISVPKETVRQSPAFFSRQFSGLSGAAQTQWARRNRMHSRVSFHHNLLHLFPPAKYTETHPEFFPLLNGQRYLPKSNDEHRLQPCFTAPGIVD